jgi:hypothetical protein
MSIVFPTAGYFIAGWYRLLTQAAPRLSRRPERVNEKYSLIYIVEKVNWMKNSRNAKLISKSKEG